MVLNILIYDNLKNVNNSNLSIKVYEKNLIKYNKKIYLLYDAKEINPPFFDWGSSFSKLFRGISNLEEEFLGF